MADRSWLDDARGVDIVDGTGESERVLSRRAKLRFSGEFTVAENPGDGGVDIGLSAESLADAAEAAVELAGDHAQRHRLGGEDEIDGDRIAISYVPDSYTRTPVPDVAGDERHLTAHLAGLDSKVAAIGQPIWEWNGVDTSQFMSASTATWTQGNITSTGLSVEDSANVIGGKVLRFTAAASDANGMAVHLIDFDFPLNFRIEYELDKFDGGTSNPLYHWGFAFLADNTDNSFHAYLAFATNGTGVTASGGSGHRVNAGSASGSNHSDCGIPGNNTTGARQRIYIEQRADLTPSAPYVRFMRSAYRITGSTSTTSYLVCHDSHLGSAASTWAGRACNKLGLAVYRSATAGTNTSHFANIAALRVYKL